MSPHAGQSLQSAASVSKCTQIAPGIACKPDPESAMQPVVFDEYSELSNGFGNKCKSYQNRVKSICKVTLTDYRVTIIPLSAYISCISR